MVILQDNTYNHILGIFDDEEEAITVTTNERLTENEYGDELPQIEYEVK